MEIWCLTMEHAYDHKSFYVTFNSIQSPLLTWSYTSRIFHMFITLLLLTAQQRCFCISSSWYQCSAQNKYWCFLKLIATHWCIHLKYRWNNTHWFRSLGFKFLYPWKHIKRFGNHNYQLNKMQLCMYVCVRQKTFKSCFLLHIQISKNLL